LPLLTHAALFDCYVFAAIFAFAIALRERFFACYAVAVMRALIIDVA